MNDAAPRAAPVSWPDADRSRSDAQLRGGRLVAARAIWMLLMAWFVASFAASLPAQLSVFQHPGALSTELAPGAVAALQRAGISLTAYAWLAVAFGSLIMLVALALAVVLFWRRGNDWMALLVSLLFPAYCLNSTGPSELFRTVPSGSPLAVANTVLLALITFAVIYAVLMLFPSGRFVPSWSWALLVAFLIWIAARTVAPTLAILFLGYPIFLGAAVACQIYRYRKVSTPVQRQQSRWAVFGLVVALLANQAFWQTAGLTPLNRSIYPPFAYLALYGSVLLIPVTFFIAIQRYHLYEIDVIIRRTLTYGTLTAILAAIYYSVVIGVQVVTQHLTGLTGQSPVVIVMTTLLVAALFAPLRRWVQALVDRAFYRTKYNATRTLAAFGEQMRVETDLEALREHVVEVVRQTMQPAQVSLWLNTPPRRNASHALEDARMRGR